MTPPGFPVARSRKNTTMPATSHVPTRPAVFGPFGGRYVPETLTRALDQLTAEYDQARGDAKFQEDLADLFCHYVGRPSPLYHAARLSQQIGRRANLSETRRPQPHRLAQDQQHVGPSPADVADGQTPRHCRDRRGPARRGHRHGMRPVRFGVRRLHGRVRHSPSAAERLQHEAARGRGPPGQ